MKLKVINLGKNLQEKRNEAMVYLFSPEEKRQTHRLKGDRPTQLRKVGFSATIRKKNHPGSHWRQTRQMRSLLGGGHHRPEGRSIQKKLPKRLHARRDCPANLLAQTTNRFRLLSSFLFGRLFKKLPLLHLPEHAFADHLFFQDSNGLIHIVFVNINPHETSLLFIL